MNAVVVQFAFAAGLLGTWVAASTDIRSRIIPNSITYSLLLLAAGVLLCEVVYLGEADAFRDRFGAFLLFGAVWLAIYALGGSGGGDVKLMAGNAALLGFDLAVWHTVFSLFFAVLYIACLSALRAYASYWPNTPRADALVAQHWRSDLVTQSTEGDRESDKPRQLAIPFAVPAALGYLPLLAMPLFPELRSALI